MITPGDVTPPPAPKTETTEPRAAEALYAAGGDSLYTISISTGYATLVGSGSGSGAYPLRAIWRSTSPETYT